ADRSAGPNGTAAADRPRDGGPAADPAPGEKPAREKGGSDWFAPRKAPATGPGAAAQGTGAPGDAPAGPGGAQGPGAGGSDGDAGRSRPDLPYFSDAP
ncbi:hypothetical protein GTY62_22255, partial [Streptomyces sp. SID724]|nr:hypothetical protein [Streptomyces sp. SID724]